ncbi:MAG: AAA family ATPase, partial [Bacteroidota bacterium]
DALRPLFSYGDGVLRLARILIEIAARSGQRLMIDEIDTGFHFSRYPDLWKVVVLSAKRHDVQLFITTHNEECLRAFTKLLASDHMVENQELARIYTLRELPNGEIKAYPAQFSGLQFAMAQDIELRGGK